MMLIRLIDIVLIILFGFISISHIDRQVGVEMPRVKYLPQEPPDFENWLVIGVYPDGSYSGDYGNIEFAYLEALFGYINEVRKENQSIKIRIRADRNAPVGALRPLVAFCDESRLSVALDMVLQDKERGAKP